MFGLSPRNPSKGNNKEEPELHPQEKALLKHNPAPHAFQK
jgi:hypothetical protein